MPACFASCAIGSPAPLVAQRDLGHALRAARRPRKRASNSASAASAAACEWKRATISCASATFASRGLRPSAHSRLSAAISSCGAERQQLVVAPHQLVGDRHQLAEHLVRRLGDADVVVERLRHLVDAVEPFEQRQRQDALRLLAVVPLQLAADQEVELLVGAAELDVGLQRDRVVALRERVEKLVDRDRLAALVALGEIVALEHARHRVLRGEPDHAVGAERRQPLRVERDLGLLAVEDHEHLVGVGLRVRLDLLARQRRPRHVAAGRVADQAGEVADQEDDVVAEVLQLAQLVELHGVAEVQVGPRRVEALLDAQRLAARELGGELGSRRSARRRRA